MNIKILSSCELKAYDEKPFKIDPAFREAFINAHKKHYMGDEDRMVDDVIPSKELLSLIYEQSTNQSG